MLTRGSSRSCGRFLVAALSHAAGTHEHSDRLPERTDEGLEAVEATAAELSGADGPLAAIGKHLSDAHASLKATTDSLLANGLADSWNALAGATPYLRMFGIVTVGRLLARSAPRPSACSTRATATRRSSPRGW